MNKNLKSYNSKQVVNKFFIQNNPLIRSILLRGVKQQMRQTLIVSRKGKE